MSAQHQFAAHQCYFRFSLLDKAVVIVGVLIGGSASTPSPDVTKQPASCGKLNVSRRMFDTSLHLFQVISS